MVDRKRINEFSDSIVEHFKPEKVVLFGSYAYGSPTEDSDVDILVILPFEGKSALKSAEILIKIDPRFPVDQLVRTPEQVRDRLEKGDFFLERLCKEAKFCMNPLTSEWIDKTVKLSKSIREAARQGLGLS